MKYDSIIIGFGKSGKTLAGALAAKGEKVALIEKSNKMYGGTCINVGCIPSKSLVNSSEISSHLENATFEEKAEFYKKAIEEKIRLTTMLRGKNFAKLDNSPNVTIYNGIGSFKSEKEILVHLENNEELVLSAEKIFINTGATPIIPNIKGIENNKYVYTSETLMQEENLPKHLVIIGAGYISMEFASIYNNFGSKVTVLQRSNEFLPKEDRDVADEIKSICEKKGIDIITNAKVSQIENDSVFYTVNDEEFNIKDCSILIAIGRKPSTELLNVENAGIELTPRGAIKTDEYLKTNVKNIWAMGDVNGGAQFTFISLDDFRVLRSQLSGNDYNVNKRQNVAYSVFMDTPLGRVGLTEKEAEEKGIPYRVVKLPTAMVPKAQVLRKTDGFLKAILNSETNEILGAALLCPEAYELVNLIKLAMDMGVKADYLANSIYTHPTMSEAFNDLFSL